ncbi:M14 family metallopeptidase [Zeaxanthinibacter enoshimensis]|uniref:Zinc carboxypeptidase n=1 Tax=Zeaxanthinibacter enoshimensis TaxID=392009 RepID=A0A4R6TM94_9FLAO|nr:M14 family metallopeptidase [Zeaxanthinibacter enoshimensis]TDQ30958.1 zinc carboxypeptidase [Zeaxanthinibacter enoshimensis]
MKQILLTFSFFWVILVFSQELKSPSEFLGYELGTEFTPHYRVEDYYQHVASTRPEQVQLQTYGHTYEGRPLLLAYLSTAANMKNLEQIREEHLKSLEGNSDAEKAIVWLSYNVHGNESVSTEASMQTIYELLTSKSSYLDKTIVIMDPAINPDGRDRYVNWYKQYRNRPNQVDPNSVEHHEGWWSGRSNHYMFDLNRDWAWLTQVESQQRLKKYNQWLPHIHVDFHEQGVNEPYYFAPAAEPYHEVITDFQRDFQETIGKNHARYFDANGWFYFTKEVFDLLYPSYGDTYPTYNGAIGMTYEQGGSGRAGLGIITREGDTLTLQDRIAHHLTTGLSTVEVASKNAGLLNESFVKYYKDRSYKYNSYVLSGNRDQLDALADLLDQHQIKYGAGTGTNISGYNYRQQKNGSSKADASSMVISTDQTKGNLVKVLFEPNAKLSDSLTYDITAWSLPYAYGLETVASERLVSSAAYKKQDTSGNSLDKATYAYVSDWNSMKDARFLASLLQQGIKVRYSQKPFRMEGKSYERGSLIITRADNANQPDFIKRLGDTARQFSKELVAVSTGFVDAGKDFGSSSVELILPPKVAVLGGEPTSTLRFGEIWHFFEQQLEYPLTVLHADYWNRVNLDEYDVLVLPDGRGYKSILDDKLRERLSSWVSQGGNLIVMGNAISALSDTPEFSVKARKMEGDSTGNSVKPYGEGEREYIKNAITGAIFKTKVDPTHPLAYGYGDTYYTLKLGNDRFEYLDGGTVVYMKDETKPIAGFAGSQAQKNRENTLIFGVQEKGRGNVIYLADNPLFRGFWENGKLFFANALFMVN